MPLRGLFNRVGTGVVHLGTRLELLVRFLDAADRAPGTRAAQLAQGLFVLAAGQNSALVGLDPSGATLGAGKALLDGNLPRAALVGVLGVVAVVTRLCQGVLVGRALLLAESALLGAGLAAQRRGVQAGLDPLGATLGAGKLAVDVHLPCLGACRVIGGQALLTQALHHLRIGGVLLRVLLALAVLELTQRGTLQSL